MKASADALQQFIDASGPLVRVEVTRAQGSTPRETGTWMLVSVADIFGTIGGGQLELMAINEARSLIASEQRDQIMDIPLGPEIGQCCGGRVALTLARLDAQLTQTLLDTAASDDDARPHVYVFGAGHVGKALSHCLSLLPVRTFLIETREDELNAATAPIEKRLSAMPESLIDAAPAGSAFIVLTHDHALDFIIIRQALLRKDAAYIGMIGSKTKRATYLSWHQNEGGDKAECDRLICPIGDVGVDDKRPQVIAALVASEVISVLMGSQAASC